MAKVMKTALKCEKCGNISEIVRKKSKTRSKGHTKHMRCWKCQEVTAHTEMKDDAFIPEFWKQ